MNFNVAVIPGDGIGPEIVREAQKVLDAVGTSLVMSSTTQKWIWRVSIDKHGVPLTDEALATAQKSDAVFLVP